MELSSNIVIDDVYYTLPKTNTSHLKNGWLEVGRLYILLSFWEKTPLFSGENVKNKKMCCRSDIGHITFTNDPQSMMKTA